MRDEGACKKEIKLMIREIVKEEFNNLKQELELLKRVWTIESIQGDISGSDAGTENRT